MGAQPLTAGASPAPALLTAFLESDPEALADTGAVWREAREAGPILQYGPSYFLTRYADVYAAIRDPERLSNAAIARSSKTEHLRQVLTGEWLEAFDTMRPFQALMLAETDDPQHARLRRIVHRVFTPRRIAALGEAAERYTDEILTDLAAQGEVVDLLPLAYRVPLLIIGDLTGVPRGDQAQVKEWSDLWVRYFMSPDERILIGFRAQNDFRSYIEHMIERHRREPEAGDLVSALLGAENDEVLTVDEFAALFFVFLVAGHETTTNLIATGTLELLRNPEQWEDLRDDPELAPNATDELLRLVSPVQTITRSATESLVLAGHEVSEGSHVFLGLASANRDPDMFQEPDALDLRRENAAQHLSLGHGIHFCLGASLARLEGAIVFRALTQRFPELELATNRLEWRGPPSFRALQSLPVRFGKERVQ